MWLGILDGRNSKYLILNLLDECLGSDGDDRIARSDDFIVLEVFGRREQL